MGRKWRQEEEEEKEEGDSSRSDPAADEEEEEEDDDDDDDDEEDDLLRRTGNFVGSSDSLPSGVLRMFYLYDMMEGRVTPVHCIRGLNEARVKEFSTKEVVRSMKINGDISGVAFTHDGSKVFVNSEEGEVYVWDMRSSRCVNRFTDDGCVKATSIAASPNGQYLACGSQSGVVNIYSQEACLTSANPKPLKAVMNLLTSATSLTFNPTSEILAAASQVEDEAVRLVHLPSLSVFSNFPVSNRKFLYRASCLDFSPHSGFFALANNKGHAPLFRLLHYKDF
ncbi:hypothetical protein INR49_019349 [Caranx melampygus]|nr:hypothetical protein INR49_019349 [Caranx melampygus]